MKRTALGVLLVLFGSLILPTAASGADLPAPVVTLSAPATVAAGGSIALTGTLLHDDGTPYAATEVAFSRRCDDPVEQDSTPLPGATTDADGAFSTVFVAGACSAYQFRAGFQDPESALSGSADAFVAVGRAATALVVQAPATAYATDAVTVSATLTGPGDVPVGGVLVTLARVGGGTVQESWTLTTGADGTVSQVDHPLTGTWTYRATFDGTVELEQAETSAAPTAVSMLSSSITLVAPASATIDVPFAISGVLTGGTHPAQIKLTVDGVLQDTLATGPDGSFAGSAVLTDGGPATVVVTYTGDAAYLGAQKGSTVAAPQLGVSLQIAPVAAARVGRDATVSGTVLGVDRAVGVSVSGAPGFSGGTLTDAAGHFSLTFAHGYFGTGGRTLTVTTDSTSRYATATATVPFTVQPGAVALTVRTPTGIAVLDHYRVTGTLAMTPAQDGWNERTRLTVQRGSTGSRTAVAVTGAGTFSVPAYAAFAGDLVLIFRAGGSGTPFAAVSRTVTIHQRVRPELRTRVVAARSVRRDISYFRRSDDPVFVTGTAASFPGVCHRYRVQRVIGGSWTTVRTSACVALNSTYAETTWRWRAGPRRGVTYRVFATVGATNRMFAGTSVARLVRFR